MFCTNCGSQFEDGNAFCPNCGTKVESVAKPVETAPVAAAPVAEPIPVATPVEAAPVAAAPVAQPIPVATPVEPAPAAAPAPAPAPQPQAIPVAPVQPVYAQPTPVMPVGATLGANDPELAKNVLIMGILAVAFTITVWISFLGIVFGAIGLSKAKKFTEECGQLFGKARVGKYLSLGGLIGGSVVTGYMAIYIISAIITVIAEMN